VFDDLSLDGAGGTARPKSSSKRIPDKPRAIAPPAQISDDDGLSLLSKITIYPNAGCGFFQAVVGQNHPPDDQRWGGACGASNEETPGLPMWPHNRGGSGKHSPIPQNETIIFKSVLFYHPKESLVSTRCRFASTQR
jgi:hypothetical protein